MEIKARNTNTLQPVVYRLLQEFGVTDSSRNGPVLRFPMPVTIEITHPWERVNICPVRNANPFFHLMEALAMIGGMNSVQFMTRFAKNMANFSDDGATYNSFYGTRLLTKWGNQLVQIAHNLLKDPDSRQEVALIWDPADLSKVTKDKACNLLLIFRINSAGLVEMTSINRSNDAIWGGVNGANIVHLSMFQEYVACALGRQMGSWWHFSNNLHVYTENPQWQALKSAPVPQNPYADPLASLVRLPLFDAPQHLRFTQRIRSFLSDAQEAIRRSDCAHLDSYQTINVQEPLPSLAQARVIFNAWQAHKSTQFGAVTINNLLNVLPNTDWKMACQAWITRTYSNKEKVA